MLLYSLISAVLLASTILAFESPGNIFGKRRNHHPSCTSTVLATITSTLMKRTDVTSTVYTTDCVTDIATTTMTYNQTITDTETLTVTTTASSAPTAINGDGCPAANGDVFPGVLEQYNIECSASYNTTAASDLLRGGAVSTDVFACAQLCDNLNRAGVICGAGVYHRGNGKCYPYGPGGYTKSVGEGTDSAVRVVPQLWSGIPFTGNGKRHKGRGL